MEEDIRKIIREHGLDEDKELSTASTYEYGEGDSKKVSPVRKFQIENELQSILGSRETIALYEVLNMLNELTTKEAVEDKVKNGYTRDDEMQVVKEYLERKGIILQSVSLEAENLNDEDIVSPTVAKRTSGVGSLDYRSKETKIKIKKLSVEIRELATKMDEAYRRGRKEGKSLEEIGEEVQDLVEQEEKAWQERKKRYNKKYQEYQEKLNDELFEKFYPIKAEKKMLEDELSYMEEGTKEYEDTLRRLEEVEDEYINVRNFLVENNQGLLYFVLNRNIQDGNVSLKNLSITDYPFSDRIQEGYLGLIYAVENHDNSKGKFSTYAVSSILYHIFNGQRGRKGDSGYPINNVSNIHIPEQLEWDYNIVNRARMNLEGILGREPTYKEIEEVTGFNPKRIRKAEQAYKLSRTESLDQDTGIVHTEDGQEINVENATKLPGEGIPEHIVQRKNITDFVDNTRTTDEVLRQGQAKVNGEVIPENEDTPFELAEGAYVGEELAKMLDTLSEIERKVLEERFGLIEGIGIPKTLEEIARMYGVTTAEIRTIESKALLKLKHPSRSKNLTIFNRDSNFDYIHFTQGDYSRAREKINEEREKASIINKQIEETIEKLMSIGCTFREASIMAHMDAMPLGFDYVTKNTELSKEEVARIINRAITRVEKFERNAESSENGEGKESEEKITSAQDGEGLEESKFNEDIPESDEKTMRAKLVHDINVKLRIIDELTRDIEGNEQRLKKVVGEYIRLRTEYQQTSEQEKGKGETNEQ